MLASVLRGLDSAGPLRLASRHVLSVQGPDVVAFLQGLCSADVAALSEAAPSAPALFLAPQGRVQAAALLARRAPDDVLVDVHAGVAAWLLKHLRGHVMRSRVALTDATARLAVVRSPEPQPGAALDRRAPGLGWRAFVDAATAPAPDPAAERLYDAARLLLGIAEGPAELPPGLAFPYEYNMDLANAVDISKGCYVGQELCTRTYHRGAVSKRLVPVVLGEATAEFDSSFAPPADGTAIEVAAAGPGDRAHGHLVRAVHNVGVLLVRLDALRGTPLQLARPDGSRVVATPLRPAHWPENLSRAYIEAEARRERENASSAS